VYLSQIGIPYFPYLPAAAASDHQLLVVVVVVCPQIHFESSLNLAGENKGMLQKLSCTRPQCGLPLETLEEKILASTRKMLRDGRV
jgi:hypothetical protein